MQLPHGQYTLRQFAIDHLVNGAGLSTEMAEEVVAKYLASHLGSGWAVHWDDPATKYSDHVLKGLGTALDMEVQTTN